MADEKRPSLTERISRLPGEAKPKLGFGKVVVPPKLPPPLPVARHVTDEKTRTDGVLGPAPGSEPGSEPWRKQSPPPDELAPDPVSRGAAQAQALQAVAEQDRQQAIEIAALRAELETTRRAVRTPLDYKGIALVLTAVGGIVATVIAARSAPVPPGVLECPARLDELERKLKKTTATTDEVETDLAEAKKDWRKADEKAEDALGEVTTLRKLVPRVEGLKPEP